VRKTRSEASEIQPGGCTNDAKRGGACVRHGVGRRKDLRRGGMRVSLRCKRRVWKTRSGEKERNAATGDTPTTPRQGGIFRRHWSRGSKGHPIGVRDDESQIGGACLWHGAKNSKPRCSHEGCDDRAINVGMRPRHGGQTPTGTLANARDARTKTQRGEGRARRTRSQRAKCAGTRGMLERGLGEEARGRKEEKRPAADTGTEESVEKHDWGQIPLECVAARTGVHRRPALAVQAVPAGMAAHADGSTSGRGPFHRSANAFISSSSRLSRQRRTR